MKQILVFVTLFAAVLSKTWHEFGVSEFLFGPAVNSYNEAKKKCTEQNAHVARIKTKGFNDKDTGVFDFIVNKAKVAAAAYPYSFYIGASRTAETSTFKWEDGSEINDGKWDTGEPAAVENKYCVIMGSITELDPNYQWRSANCSVTSRYICQRSTVPVSTSTTTSTRTVLSTTTTIPSQPISSSTEHITTGDAATDSDPPRSSSSTTGTVAGIVVVLVVLLIAAAVAFVMLLKRRRSANQPLNRADAPGKDELAEKESQPAVSEVPIYATTKPRKQRESHDDIYVTAMPVEANYDDVYSNRRKEEQDYDVMRYN